MSRVTSFSSFFMVLDIAMASPMRRQQLTKGTLPWAANGVKGMLEYNGGRKGTEKMQIIRIYTSFPPLPILQLLKFPMLNHLKIPELFSNLLYFARSLVQINHKTDKSCQK